MAGLGVRCCVSFSLVAVDGGYAIIARCRLFFAVASLVAEHSL